MPPPHERFPAADNLGAEVDDRLVMCLELFPGESDPNLVEQASMIVDLLAQAGLENTELVAPIQLGLVQRDIGVLQQGFGHRGFGAAEASAHADG